MVNEPTAFIGDVHGDSDRLMRAVTTLTHEASTLVFVGDYVNRGPDSKGVLDLLVELRSQLGDRLILLRGNHDAALLDYIRTGKIGPFAAIGGLATIRSYCSSPSANVHETLLDSMPTGHLHLLEATTTYFETSDLLVSHSGYDPNNPGARLEKDLVRGQFPQLFQFVARDGAPLVICGHYIQAAGIPFVSESFVCIDTGCGSLPSGPLTAFLLPQRSVRQF